MRSFGLFITSPFFRGGGDGMRNCELVMERVGGDDYVWTPLFKPNQYSAGLKVGRLYECSDDG